MRDQWLDFGKHSKRDEIQIETFDINDIMNDEENMEESNGVDGVILCFDKHDKYGNLKTIEETMDDVITQLTMIKNLSMQSNPPRIVPIIVVSTKCDQSQSQQLQDYSNNELVCVCVFCISVFLSFCV